MLVYSRLNSKNKAIKLTLFLLLKIRALSHRDSVE